MAGGIATDAEEHISRVEGTPLEEPAKSAPAFMRQSQSIDKQPHTSEDAVTTEDEYQ